MTNILLASGTEPPKNDLEYLLHSETAVLIDGYTGQVLFEKNMNQQMYPASITKIMTALLALENGKLDDIITMSRDAVFSVGRTTSHIALDTDENLTLEQALYALAIASANDAANGIAEHIGGSMDNFAVMMNDRAKKAGALNTNFINAHGLPDSEHYTTAYDMARIMMEAVKLPEFNKIFSSIYYEMPPTNKQLESRYFRSTNSILNSDGYEGVIASKNGWTTDSQHTLVTAAEREGILLIAVVMKSPDTKNKWEDTERLFDYGFEEYANIAFSVQESEPEEDLYAPSDEFINDTLPEQKTEKAKSKNIVFSIIRNIIVFSAVIFAILFTIRQYNIFMYKYRKKHRRRR